MKQHVPFGADEGSKHASKFCIKTVEFQSNNTVMTNISEDIQMAVFWGVATLMMETVGSAQHSRKYPPSHLSL